MTSPSRSRRVTIVFRYDDYSQLSPGDFEEKLIDVFRRRGASCAFGVIPFPRNQSLSGRKAEILKKAVEEGIVEPVLHGHSHLSRARERESVHPSELSGLSAAEQKKLFASGRSFLEELLGKPVGIFAPPWNSYDRQTLTALEDLGFEALSSGPRFGAVETRGSLSYLPATCPLTELMEGVATARGHSDDQALVVAWFHAYDFVEVDPDRGVLTLEDLAQQLDGIAAREDSEVSSLGAVLAGSADTGAARYALNRSLKKNLAFTPPFLRKRYRKAPRVYLSSRQARRMNRANVAWIGSFHLAALFFSALLSAMAFGIAQLGEEAFDLVRYGGPAVVVAVCLYAFRHARLSYKGVLAIALVLGAYLGAMSRLSP